MTVLRISRNPESLDRGDSAEDERELSFRQRRGAGHERDVAHGTIAPDGDVEQRRGDSTGKNSSLHRSAARMGDVEDRLVDRRLGGEAGGRENELLVRVLPAVDSRKNRRATAVEADVRMESHRDGAQDVRAFVRHDAGAETEGESPPVIVGRTSYTARDIEGQTGLSCGLRSEIPG